MKRTIIALVLGMLIGSSATALAANTETVQAVFAEFKIMINGQEKQLQTTPLVVEGTSYLPVREVANLLGAKVGYDDASRTITLNNKESLTVGSTFIEGRTLLELVAKKYNMTYKDGLSLWVNESDSSLATFQFGKDRYQLKIVENKVDASPLIEKGIIDQAELNQ